MSHESLVVAVDPATGGIRGINAIGEESARLGQQVVIAGLVGPDGKPARSRMRATSVQVEASGPALARITSGGRSTTRAMTAPWPGSPRRSS